MRLLAIVGPTATGKTPLAVAVAQRLGAELLNADSRQVIRGLRVGTCAPTPSELAGVPCHLLDLREPDEPFTTADWLHAAEAALAEVTGRGRQAVLVGGTGLYVSALIDGLDLAGVPPDPERRAARAAQLRRPGGHEALIGELVARDPSAGIDVRNPRRLLRALEILDARGGPLAAARRRGPGRAAVAIGLDLPTALHDEMIRHRAERMIRTGALMEEVDSALHRGVSREALDAAGIGYREALALRDGRLSPDGAVAALVQRTRRYAKAQRTWFRRDPRIRWLERRAAAADSLVDEVVDALREDARSGERLHRRRRS
jgi:tRNA dimethylallyltransferase